MDLPLKSLINNPTVAGLALEIERRKNEQDPAFKLPTIVPVLEQRHLPFPLTDLQQAYWAGRSGAFELGNVSTHFYMEIESVGLDIGR